MAFEAKAMRDAILATYRLEANGSWHMLLKGARSISYANNNRDDLCRWDRTDPNLWLV